MSFAVPRSDSRTSGVGDYEATDVARNIGSLLRYGKISSVNHAQRLCRVELNAGLITDEIPWISQRAGGNTFWNSPSVGESVLLISPSGELNNSVALPSLQSNPQGSWPYAFDDLEFQWGELGDAREALWRWLFDDGALLENDPARHQFRIEQVQTRLRGQQICHLQSDQLIYIDGDTEEATVHVKAPIIKLEGDVQITGQLLQGGRIVGTEPDGEGLKELLLVGDPIKLNGGGGILGIAAGLLGTVAGGFSLGTLGGVMGAFGGSLTGGLGQLASGVLGSTGLGSLVSALPVSGLSGALSLTGALEVVGTVANAVGFPGSQYINAATGLAGLAQGITNGDGLNLTGAFQGLGQVGQALGIPGASDFTALSGIAGGLTDGSITTTDFVDVLTGVSAVAGFTPPAGITPEMINSIASAATGVVSGGVDDAGQAVVSAGVNFLGNAPEAIMSSIYGSNAPASAQDIANKIAQLGLASNLEALEASGDSGGQIIGQFINDGSISLEQVLGMAGTFGGLPDSVAADAVQGAVKNQKFWEHFERSTYKPDSLTPRDMSDAAGSDTDPQTTTIPEYMIDAYSAVDFSNIA